MMRTNLTPSTLTIRRHLRVWATILCVCLATSPLGLQARPRQKASADEAPQARAYFNWLDDAINSMSKDIALYTKAADLAAPVFIEGGALKVAGDPALASEMNGRAGGIMHPQALPNAKRHVILHVFGQRRYPTDLPVFGGKRFVPTSPTLSQLLDKQIAQAQADRLAGHVVIGLGSVEQLKAKKMLAAANQACDVLLDNHGPANETDIPKYVTINPVAAWMFHCELFAACTRLDKTPIMYASVFVPEGRPRIKRYKGQRFHQDKQVPPIPAGQLGMAYNKAVSKILYDIGTTSWKALSRTAYRAGAVDADGGKLWLFTLGHYPPFFHDGQLPADPRVFQALNPQGKGLIGEPEPQDFVLAVGYCLPPGHRIWGTNADGVDGTQVFRYAKRGVSWVIAAYDTTRKDLRQNEILIDQQWAPGDAIVKVPGYDIRIGPSSAVTTGAITWAITAQVHHEIKQQRAATRKRKS